MPYANEKRIPLAVSTSTAGANTLIAAPGDGKFLAIDFIALNPDGGAQTVTITTGTATVAFALNDNQPLTIENAIHDPEGIFTCSNNTAFTLTLGAATSVTGYVKYRICG
jgi:hypothetical protein